MENNMVPEIRFEKFSNYWNYTKLISLVDKVKSYTLSREFETSYYTGYKYVHYGDIHTKIANIIDESTNLPNIKEGKYDLLKKGDLVLADASEDYHGIAAPAVITTSTSYKLVAGLHTIALRPNNAYPLYLYYLFNSLGFRKYGYKAGTGMKVFGISFTNLVKFESHIPCIKEQTQIGNFFKQLDDTIALKQRELENLKQTKQGFLQKMFPKEGEAVPELRFPGFTDEWEQRKLDDVALITMGQSPKGENYTQNPKDYILVQGNADIKNGWVTPRIWTTQVTKSANKEDIIFSVRAPVGDVAKTQYNVILGRGVAGIKANEFIYQTLCKMKLNGSWTRYSTGSTFDSINSNNLKEVLVNVPFEEEQTLIGNFFKKLDDTISLHEQELESLKLTKKAFLQKMFI